MPHTFVLVHGLFHGGWCWRRVADPLRAAGHQVFTPTNTGMGERAHLLGPDVGLATFIADVVGVLEAEELTDVVLVGHSFGAITVLGAADRAAARLRSLILMDGLIPTPGRRVFDSLPAEVVAERTRLAEEFSGGLALPPFSAVGFGVTEPEDAAWLERRFTPHPLRAFTDPLWLAHPLGNGLRCTYLGCTDPAYPLVTASHQYARARPDWAYRELATGHDAMVIAPHLVVEALLECA